MQELITVILAAGAGTRMKSSMAKVAHSACGKPLLTHVISGAESAGTSELILVLGHGADQVGKIAPEKAAIVIQEQQLGTGHAMMQAESHLTGKAGTVLVLYGDTPLITGQTLQEAFAAHQQGNNQVTVLTALLDDPTGYGRIVRDKAGQVTGIVEQKDASQEQRSIREINSGMYFFDIPALLKALGKLTNHNNQKEYYLTDTIGLILSDGGKADTFIIQDSCEIMGVNDRIQLAEAEKILNNRNIASHMRNGVTFLLPETTLIHSDVTIGKDTILYPGCILEKGTSIGEGSVIGPNSRISNSTIGCRTHIMNSVIIDSKVGNDTKVGPFAYLRPHSHIGDHVKIGDFVEIKKSVIGDHTKVSHLTYIGDAEVGKNVNVGCGVVFVNYDGVNKNKTLVGDNAFIGCNVNLVSPVEVKENAYIAAGSTITDEVPSYALAIARSRQSIISDWVKKKGLNKK